MAELTEEEKAILAYTLLGEAAGEGRKGMEAVMHVIQNRSESGRYPASPRDVALQKSKGGTYQFTTWSPRHGNDPVGTYSKSSKSYQTAL
jgi:spore germination cell wall hydrolase CwlJ-like protein